MSTRAPIFDLLAQYPEILAAEGRTWADVDAALAEAAASAEKDWSEEDHPREPAGSSEGGQFTESPGGGGGAKKPKGDPLDKAPKPGTKFVDQEAEKIITQYQTISVSYLGRVSVAMQRRVAHAVEAVYKDYPGLEKLQVVGTKPFKAEGPLGAPMAEYEEDARSVMLNRVRLATVERTRRVVGDGTGVRKYWEEYKTRLPEGEAKTELLKVFARPAQWRPWQVDQSIEGLLRHEIGHHAYSQLLKTSPNALFAAKDAWREGQWGERLSGYGAGQNFKEYFAEAFVAHTAVPHLVEPKLAALVDTLRQKKP